MIFLVIAFLLGVTAVTIKEPVPSSQTSQEIRENGHAAKGK